MMSHRIRVIVLLAMACLFAILVGSGITGASFHLGLQLTSAVVEHDSSILAGQPRLIRSDEWATLSPLWLLKCTMHRQCPF